MRLQAYHLLPTSNIQPIAAEPLWRMGGGNDLLRPGQPVPKPAQREKPRSKGLQRRQPLRQRSRSEVGKRREEELEVAKLSARAYWGPACLVPGCPRAGTQLHHAYGRGSHPQHRAASWNLLPLCGGERGHHRDADLADHWMHNACREVADEVRAHADGRRPRVGRNEATEILRRHREKAERPHVSPIGPAD